METNKIIENINETELFQWEKKHPKNKIDKPLTKLRKKDPNK